MCLCVVSWAQALIYYHKWAVWKATTLAIATLAVFGGVEAALILTIRVSLLVPSLRRLLYNELVASSLWC